MPDFLVDAVATTNVDLAAPPAVLDTFPLVAGTSTVALVGQTDETENGIYDYTLAGALERNATDGAPASMVYPTTFGVRGGSPDNKHSEFAFGNDAAAVLGTDPVVVYRYAWPRALDASGGLTRSISDLSIATTGITKGTYSRATFNERGQATSGQAAEEATTFMEGLRLVWLSANSLRVEEGAMYVPAAGRVLDLAFDEDLTGLGLAANTPYFLYGYEEGDVLAIDPPSLQRPASPYRGEARVKGGGVDGVLDNANPDAEPDDTRRLVGGLHATAANTIGGLWSVLDRVGSFQQGDGPTVYNSVTATTVGLLSDDLRGVGGIPLDARGVFVMVRVPGSSNKDVFIDSADAPPSSANSPRHRVGTIVTSGHYAVPLGKRTQPGRLRLSGETDGTTTSNVTVWATGWWR